MKKEGCGKGVQDEHEITKTKRKQAGKLKKLRCISPRYAIHIISFSLNNNDNKRSQTGISWFPMKKEAAFYVLARFRPDTPQIQETEAKRRHWAS